ncbi:Magnesium transport protein CorA, transmembrane region [Glarea lozoyensis ATCC 20868]|uniref:Magnesium transport protein CorA, transmembrane region n=1 Tax=Glarea lozoyensis (strain ATCC 20868 / MF5171) TaxID=1116229 RepID=S3CHJ8_GLAL2|nr:Magnesium transport protein CorA, transmembrane region [Glarea lozoyensis ATCC 20868]EPE25310.1 Magnesium transport protein CorA, transmembrane region [Glarea lozoyensis ATCC 20868]
MDIYMQYTLVYPEESPVSTGTSWTLRQTGVFNRFVSSMRTQNQASIPIDQEGPSSTQPSNPNLLILLHPKQNSILQTRLTHSRSTNPFIQPFFTTHLLILSTYLPSWRFYISHLNTKLESIADIALTLQFTKPSHSTEAYTQLRALKHLEDQVLPLTARFQTTLATIRKLLDANDLFHSRQWSDTTTCQEIRDELQAHETYMNGHLITVTLLQKRVSEILNLLNIALSLKNQGTSVQINEHMLALTKDTVDDSASVRVVTIVTLIYLPASFVSSFLGMNLFDFNAEGGGFGMSSKFWVFFVMAIPLTMVTIGIWFYISQKKRNKIRAEEDGLFIGGR